MALKIWGTLMVYIGIICLFKLQESQCKVCSYACSESYRERYTTSCYIVFRCTRHRTRYRYVTCYRCCAGYSGDCSSVVLSPTLDWKIGNRTKFKGKPEVVFICNLNHPDFISLGYKAEVQWYRENRGFAVAIFPNKTQITQSQSVAELHEEDYYTVKDALSNRPSLLGGEFFCTVRVLYGADKQPGPLYTSNKFFAGIELLTTSISLKENEQALIKVRPTIPVLSKYRPELKDKQIKVYLTIPLVLPSGHELSEQCGRKAGYEMQSCAIQIESIPYRADTWAADYEEYKKREFSIQVNGAPDDVYGSRTMRVKFHGAGLFLPHVIWTNVILHDALVSFTDLDVQLRGKMCRSINDPHMTSFDGRNYENQNEGEFILYKHKTLPLQVNAFFKSCNAGRATCNCAVAVRSGKGMFIVDMCGRGGGTEVDLSQSKLPMRAVMLDCDEKHMKISLDQRIYTIVLPGATVVTISPGYGDLLNVVIKPSVQDIDKVEGLCGNLNGNPHDDFVGRGQTLQQHGQLSPQDFSISWRVTESESFYNGMKGKQGDNWPQYCSCKKTPKPIESYETGEVKCEPAEISNSCDNSGDDITERETQRCRQRSSRRKRRDVTSSDKAEFGERDFIYDPNRKFQTPSWVNGWDETRARTFCTEYIKNSHAGRVCGKVTDVNMKGPIEDCVKDIHISGGTNWKEEARDSMKQQCKIEVMKNRTLWEKSPGTGALRPPSAFTDVLCVGDCEANGKCMNGTCHCAEGYGGVDCSLDLSTPPANVYILAQDKQCKTNVQQCISVAVYGDNFAQNINLICKIRTCKIRESDNEDCSTDERVQKAQYEHFEKVICPLSNTRFRRSTADSSARAYIAMTYYISVSNNGANFSSETSIIAYNDQCTECSNMTCVYRNDTEQCTDTTPAAAISTTDAAQQRTINPNVNTNNNDTDLILPLVMTCVLLALSGMVSTAVYYIKKNKAARIRSSLHQASYRHRCSVTSTVTSCTPSNKMFISGPTGYVNNGDNILVNSEVDLVEMKECDVIYDCIPPSATGMPSVF